MAFRLLLFLIHLIFLMNQLVFMQEVIIQGLSCPVSIKKCQGMI